MLLFFTIYPINAIIAFYNRLPNKLKTVIEPLIKNDITDMNLDMTLNGTVKLQAHIFFRHVVVTRFLHGTKSNIHRKLRTNLACHFPF